MGECHSLSKAILPTNQQQTISCLHLQLSYLGQHKDVLILFIFCCVLILCIYQKMVVVSPAQMCIVLSCCFHGCICAKKAFVFAVLLFWYLCFLLLCPFYDIFFVCKCYLYSFQLLPKDCSWKEVNCPQWHIYRNADYYVLSLWTLKTDLHKVAQALYTGKDRQWQTLTSVPCCISNL